jgi:hypothetical protein
MAAPVPSCIGSILTVDLFRVEPKPLGFHRAEGTNDHIEQFDAAFFARNPVGFTYDQLPAMLTSAIHILSSMGK